MRFGLTTPVVTMVPRTHAAWERDAGVAEIRQIATTADRLGYFHLSCSEHVGIPVDIADQHRGSRYYDPAATLGYIAACTSRIRLLTHVLVLPYHHPLAVAKTYGTLDRLSGGRVILGVGVGSLREEFELLGIDFAGRGARYEDALRALRVALGQTQPAYEGSHYRFAGFRIDPCAVQERLPIWVGGRSPRSLRRALAFAEGWDPFGLGLDQLATMLDGPRQSTQWRAGFEVVLSPEQPLAVDTAAEVDAARATVAAYAAVGATAMNLRFVHHGPAHYLECLERFAAEIMNPRGAQRDTEV
ncbi:MAG TPA: TIGR03619 family F420-dependent LLM class oxidoreductase [Candidatus Dormibacteraeota bacterium]|nr:TIGR03619 family F420-dependent LLM class oxidoreductase [Candidatus Dormibacteraeota bacterium]